MRHACLFVLFLFFAVFGRADPSLTLTRITPHLYLCEDNVYANENSLVYVGETGVTIIGATWTPATAELLAHEIEKVTNLRVSEVVNTNYHTDRAGGNAYWKSRGCEIHATQRTCNLLRTDWAKILAWTQRAFPQYPAIDVCLPTQSHDGDFELQGGRVKVFYLGPSHTPDGVFVYFPGERVLYGGCILKEQLGNLDFADMPAYPRTLRKLQGLKLDIRVIVAGHGKPLHGPDLIAHYLELIDQKAARDSADKTTEAAVNAASADAGNEGHRER